MKHFCMYNNDERTVLIRKNDRESGWTIIFDDGKKMSTASEEKAILVCEQLGFDR